MILNKSLEVLHVARKVVDGGLKAIRVFSVRVLVVAVKLHLTPVVVVGLCGVGAVLVVKDLAGQAVGSHALLGSHFVSAHLQRDG